MKVGIIGCGSIARQRHAHEYGLRPDVEIVGFFDNTAERAQECAAAFGGKVFASVEELLSDKSIDAVSVCVPNRFHSEYTIKALEAGKHVLCEKPMGITYEQCTDMVQAAHKAGKRLMIGQNQRLLPAHQKAKELISSGELGRVLSFRTVFGHKGPEMWSVDKGNHTWFFRKSTASMGSMADLGIHKIDLMRYLIGRPVASVYSKLTVLDKKLPDGSPIEVDDNSVEILEFAGGPLGTVTTSWTHYGEECNSTVLYCEGGIVKLYDDPEYSLQIVRADGRIEKLALDRIQTNEDGQQASSGVIDEFVEAVETGRESILDAEDVLKSMEVVFACLRSAEEGRAVQL